MSAAAASAAGPALRHRRSWWSRTVTPRIAIGVGCGLVLTAIALALHDRALNAHLWIDEGISIGIASHPLGSIPHVLRFDGSPPLYYVLLHVWTSAFGTSAATTHSLSLLCAVLAVPAALWAGWSTFGPRAGIASALLACFSPFLALYADETRMYSLVFLLATLATGAFLHALVWRRRRYAVVLAILMAALLYTHGWGLFFMATAGVAALGLLTAGPDRRGLAIDIAIAFGGAALLFAPWVPTLLFQSHHTGAPWSHKPVGKSLGRALTRMLGGRIPEDLLLVAGLGGAAGALWRRGPRERRSLLALLALSAGTLLLAWGFSRVATPAWALRYLVIVLAPLVILLGAGLARAGVVGMAALAVTIGAFWLGKPPTHTFQNKSNVATIANALGPELPRGTLVASPAPEEVPVLHYYLPSGMRFLTPLGAPHDPRVMDWVDALRRLRASRVHRVLMPALDTLAPGTRLLLVRPLYGKADSPWTKGIQRIELRWRTALLHDRAFTEIRDLVPSRYSSRATVAGDLFVRRHGSARTLTSANVPGPRATRSTSPRRRGPTGRHGPRAARA
jgi:hypothetical protein